MLLRGEEIPFFGLFLGDDCRNGRRAKVEVAVRWARAGGVERESREGRKGIVEKEESEIVKRQADRFGHLVGGSV